MTAALIPAQYVPIARTDADWAFDIDFQGEDWTGSAVKVAFARQGLPAEQFEIDAMSGDGAACAIRISAASWAEKTPGTWSAEVRKFDGEAIDDAAVFKLLLSRGVSDTTGPAGPPAGDGTSSGGVVVSRVGSVAIVRGGAGPIGKNEAQLLFEAGLIDEPTVEALNDYRIAQATAAADNAVATAVEAFTGELAGKQPVSDQLTTWAGKASPAGSVVGTSDAQTLTNKTLAAPAFTGTPTGLTKTHVGLSAVDNTADSAKPVSTPQQTALNLKADLSSPTFVGTVSVPTPTTGDASDRAASTSFVSSAIQAIVGMSPADLDTLSEIAGRLQGEETNLAALVTVVSGKLAKSLNLSDLPNPAAARSSLGLSVGVNVQGWNSGLDAVAALSTTAYGRSFLTFATAGAAKTALALIKGDVGLGNVDNTSDASKPVSTAQQTALNLKANDNDAGLVAARALLVLSVAPAGGATALNAAIAAANATSFGMVRIVLLPGLLNLGNTAITTLTKNDVEVVGGRDVYVRFGSGHTGRFLTISGTRVAVRNFTLEYAAGAAYSEHPFDLPSGSDRTISDITLINGPALFRVGNTSYATRTRIYNITINGWRADLGLKAIQILRGVDVNVSDVICTGTVAGVSSTRALDISPLALADTLRFRDVQFYTSGRTEKLVTVDWTSASIANVWFDNCVFDESTAAGMEIISSGGAFSLRWLTIAGTRVSTYTGNCIRIAHGGTGLMTALEIRGGGELAYRTAAAIYTEKTGTGVAQGPLISGVRIVDACPSGGSAVVAALSMGIAGFNVTANSLVKGNDPVAGVQFSNTQYFCETTADLDNFVVTGNSTVTASVATMKHFAYATPNTRRVVASNSEVATV